MRSDADVRKVFELAATGASKSAISRGTGVSRAQIRVWLQAGQNRVLDSPMRAARSQPHDSRDCPLVVLVPHRDYAYLLGQYLGDGCVSALSRARWKLRISTCDAYPRIRAETVDAIRSVLPDHAVGLTPRAGCTEVSAYSNHWPCLFPQAGPGMKHLRPIMLEPWQRSMAIDEHPDAFVRGLIHSDDCRVVNRVRRRLPSGDRWYEYPRYFFVNKSLDIQALFLDACAALGVQARPNNRWSISVARRESVKILDTIVGPKS